VDTLLVTHFRRITVRRRFTTAFGAQGNTADQLRSPRHSPSSWTRCKRAVIPPGHADLVKIHCWGAGPRVVLVHGALLVGRHAWREQRSLCERWELIAPEKTSTIGDRAP
ncbi:MAG TPA: hypothetical protein VF477_11855, partial [Mycobacterium sp.]